VSRTTLLLTLSLLGAESAAVEPAAAQPVGSQSLSSQPQATESPLTAERAVALALANSPTLRAVEQRLPEETARGDLATALENPQLLVQNLRSDRLITPGVTGQPYSAHPFANTSLWLKWAPPNPWVYSSRRAEAAQHQEEAKAELELARRRLVARVEALHATSQSLDRQLELARAAVALREQLARLTERRVAHQAARAWDQSQAELDEFEARTLRVELERKQREARRELLVELGLPPQTPLALAGAPRACEPPAVSGAELIEQALARDPTLRLHRARAAALAAQSLEARLALAPWFDYVQAGYVLASDERPAYASLRFGLTLPVLNWNGHRVDLLSARRQREEAEGDGARRAVASDVEQALADIREDASLLEHYRQAEPLLVAQSQAQLEQALAAGQSSLLEVAAVQSRTLGARRAGLRAELHCQLSLIELERLLGAFEPGAAP